MRIPPLVPKIAVLEDVEYLAIDPVPEGTHRPFWSVMIPTYNRADYLERTLKSVLEQAPGPDEMQIEVVDNCSTKCDTEAIVKRLAGDRISFFRQPETVIPNLQGITCMRRSRGRWVHIQHDDDMVMPGFYDTYKRFIDEHTGVVLVYCRAIAVDENDEWKWIMSTAPHQEHSGVVEVTRKQLLVNL